MKKIFIVLALVNVVAAAEGLPQMPKDYCASRRELITRMGNHVSHEVYPDADTLILEDRVHTKYETNGEDITWDEEWRVALTEKGVRKLNTVSVDVSERYGEAEIQLVEIVHANGDVQKVDFATTLKKATDNSSMGSNIYDPLDKRITCAVPGMKVGDIRHIVICRRILKPRMKNAWGDLNMFELNEPILRAIVTIDQPNDRVIQHAKISRPFSNTVVRAENRRLPQNRTLLKWTAENVPQAFPEPSMPPLHRELQSLLVSTIKDWPSVSRWYWDLCHAHLAKTTPAMTNKVTELTAHCRTDNAKLRAIFKFVSQEIRYMGLTLEDTAPGYEPHDVCLTFENRYGVCRDKAALLVAMLRIAGFKAFPVLINVGAKLDAEVPLPFFNHAIVAVESGNSFELMDPTNESTHDLFPPYLSNCSYLVAHPRGEQLRVSQVCSVQQNMLDVKSDGFITDDGAAILTTRLDFGGLNDTAFRHAFLKRTQAERRIFLSNFLTRACHGAELMECTILPEDLRNTEQPLAVTLTVKYPELILKGRTTHELQIPFLTTKLNLALFMLDENTALESRRFPLVFDSTVGCSETISLRHSPTLGKITHLPPPANVSITNAYTFLRSFTATNNTITATRIQQLSAVEFPPTAYSELREKLKDTETAERGKIFFAANSVNEDVANTRTLFARTFTHFTSDREWVTTNIYRREILSYKGKKSEAELKLNFAPNWQEVEIVSAVVSNRDGTVHHLTPKEISIMDAGYVAKAPCYPERKIMVVSLPSVEIGSVIDVTQVRRVRSSPVPYCAIFAFDSFDPIDEKQVEVEGFLSRTERNLPVIPRESAQPPAVLWRDIESVSHAKSWQDFAHELNDALAAARDKETHLAREVTQKILDEAKAETPEDKIRAIRKFLKQNIRIAGPELFDLPFDTAFTTPDRALNDGYASMADWMNLYRVMLEEADFEVHFMLTSGDANGYAEEAKHHIDTMQVDEFDSLLMTATAKQSLWQRMFSSNEPILYVLGRESEYSAIGSHISDGDHFLMLDSGEFIISDGKPSQTANTYDITIRENGAADFDVTKTVTGYKMGDFRKKLIEMNPTDRDRYFQGIVGQIAQNATATSELMTNTASNDEVSMQYRAYVPFFATMDADLCSIMLPKYNSKPFNIGDKERETPFGIKGDNSQTCDTFTITLPEGYTLIEHLPSQFAMDERFLQTVNTSVRDDGRLVVKIVRTNNCTAGQIFGAEYFTFLRDWNSRYTTPANKIITVRRTK